MAVYPAAVATDSDLYIAVNAVSTQLTDNPLSNSATTVNVVSTTSFPTVGFISIDSEIIKYTGKTGTSFTGCTRGADGTTATSHVQNSQVFHNVIAAHHNVLKDEIIAIESQLNAKLGTSGSAYTLSRALQTNASTGIIEVSSVTNTELGYVSGVTSAIQTQLNAKATDSLAAHLAGSETFSGQKTFSLAILGADGTASLPGHSFSADPDTGLFRSTTNTLDLATGGTSRFTLSTTELTLTLPTYHPSGSAASPSITFTSDPDSGLYRVGANDIALSVNGAIAFEVTTTTNDFYIGGTLTAELNSARFRPQTDNSIELGSSTIGWQRIYSNDGTVSLPAVTFSGDADSGLYRIGANNIALGTAGTRAIEITSSQAVKIKGTSTNDAASSGDVGEYIEAEQTTATNAPTTGNWGDLTSISVPAGDWDITGMVNWLQNGATVTDVEMGIKTTSGNSAPNDPSETQYLLPPTTTANSSGSLTIRKSFSATTTVYLKYEAVYSAGTPKARGHIHARRVR